MINQNRDKVMNVQILQDQLLMPGDDPDSIGPRQKQVRLKKQFDFKSLKSFDDERADDIVPSER